MEETAAPQTSHVYACQPVWQPVQTGQKLLATYLAQWYRARTADARPGTRKTLIVALARKLLLALWRFATTGQPPAGIALRPAMAAAG